MDATTLAALITGAAVVIGAVVAHLGKRAENATNRMNSEFDQLQEERDGLRDMVTARDQRIAELLEQRLADQVQLARLRVTIVEMGGQPP